VISFVSEVVFSRAALLKSHMDFICDLATNKYTTPVIEKQIWRCPLLLILLEKRAHLEQIRSIEGGRWNARFYLC